MESVISEIEPGEVLPCIVDRIIGTTVFVKVLYKGKELEGSIITSEIAPGRIRNLRDYVVPKKRIICKVLRITKSGGIELSLRRVTQKEKKEVLEQIKQEKGFKQIIKNIAKEKSKKIIEEIRKEGSFTDFLESLKKDESKLEKIAGKTLSKKILDALNSQKKKKAILKKELEIHTDIEDGIVQIKKVLSEVKNAKLRYISAGKYSIEAEDEDMKSADKKLTESIESLKNELNKKEISLEIK